MVSFLGFSLRLVIRAITNGTRNALKVDIPFGGDPQIHGLLFSLFKFQGPLQISSPRIILSLSSWAHANLSSEDSSAFLAFSALSACLLTGFSLMSHLLEDPEN